MDLQEERNLHQGGPAIDLQIAGTIGQTQKALSTVLVLLQEIREKQDADSRRILALQEALDELARDIYERFEGRP